ncbi:MAG: hypothetical protein J6C87_04375 [Bacteroides sp.]|nr:hypothetical protein [Bacteroides sp.]
MKKFILLLLGCAALSTNLTSAQETSVTDKNEAKKEKTSKLSIGGYGEAVYTRNFFSDKYLRYTDAETYKNDKSHGRFDLPHVVLWLGYDFGNGWSMGTEIEFEHGGTESAVEIEEEEGGEYESEVERGGEVALEQFWINKALWGGKMNIKVGHIIVPVGATNMYHMPNEFFTNYRPEGENTIMPCTWHETGISLWGNVGKWRYEVMFLPGLDSDRFGQKGWIHDGAGSPYEFKIANAYAGAFRIDNFSIKGLRLSVSGYAGNSFKNTLSATDNEKYKDVKGTVLIGAFDFCYNAHNWIARGNFDYGHLSDSEMITKYNMSMRKDSPSPKQAVASDAIAAGIEAGYDIFSLLNKKKLENQRFYLFGRYEYYDSMYKTENSVQDYKWCGRQRIAVGVNYCPIKDIVVKGEYSIGLLDSRYNNEPSISLGIAYAGLFKN